jgi:meiotically up-regulated gene 157 (Mug157) protein
MIRTLGYVLGCVAAVRAAIPSTRPPADERTYSSSVINNLIDELGPLFSDPDMGTLFGNCLPNTLDTTVLYASDGSDGTTLDSFVITGDISALWLRDSANQLMPYVPYVSEDPALASLVEGLIARHARSVLLDPFANAFNYNASGEGHQHDIVTPPMTRSVFESKYEIDSLGAFLKISYWYYRYSGSTTFITEEWLAAVRYIRIKITNFAKFGNVFSG